MRRIALVFATVALASLASAGALLAFMVSSVQGVVVLPSGFIQSPVVSGLTGPTDMEFAPDGRLFVAEEAGKVRIIKRLRQ